MSGERAPECFQALFDLLDSTSKVLAPWSFQFDPVIAMSDPKDIKIRCDEVLSSFPVDSWSFLNGVLELRPERMRIWVVCNVNESMAKDLQLRIDRCIRSFVWLERIKQRFSAMDPDKRDEPRMARIMARSCERCLWSFLGLETFIGDLCAAMNWKRGNGSSGDGKPLAQQVETKDDSSRPEMDVQECIRSLRKCAQDFRDARNHRGAESFRLLNYIRASCNCVLSRLWNGGYLRSVAGISKVVGSGDIAHLYLAEHLIGFTKSHEVDSGYWKLKSGLIEQESIYLSEVDGPTDEFTQWDVHGFEVLGRYVAGCEKLAKIVEQEAVSTSDHMVIDASRPEEASLPEAALKAIVDGGMAGVFTQAGKLSAAQRHSKTMMEMLKKDSRYYAWTVEDWARHLGAGKKTILETDAWDHIKRWREENKRERLGE